MAGTSERRHWAAHRWRTRLLRLLVYAIRLAGSCQLGGAAREVGGEAARDEVAVRPELFGVADFGAIGVCGRGTELPGSDLRDALPGFALVGDDGVVGEEGDDPV